jgi:hypothetical protein
MKIQVRTMFVASVAVALVLSISFFANIRSPLPTTPQTSSSAPVSARASYKASLEPQTQVGVRSELLDPLLDPLLNVARELLELFQKGV